MSVETCGGCSVVNILDARINDLVLEQTTLHLYHNGEHSLSSLSELLSWYLQMKRKARTGGVSGKDTAPNVKTQTELAFQILREQSPGAANEIREYFAIIQKPTAEDHAILTFLMGYKIFYSPLNQARRMLDQKKCQRECSIGFAKWYVWARMTLNLKPKRALEFACTALMAKCEGLSQSGTGAKSVALWK